MRKFSHEASSLGKVALFGLLLYSVHGEPSPETIELCATLDSSIPEKLLYPQDDAYAAENKKYYNIGLAEMMPACILQATTAEEVSTAIKLLNTYTTVPFAIKSGGHDPNAGDSSVKDGLLIALSQMNKTSIDPAAQVAQFGPGGHWADLMKPMDDAGFAVVGGRLGIVGVGGYMMQGGLSYLSAQYGMAADSILEYEMVLANGSITNISYEKNKDLVVAMRGGGNQFGICTKFTTQAYPIGKVWGGIRMYLANSRELYEAMHDYILNPPTTKSAIIFTHGQPAGFIKFYMLFFFYDGPEPPAGAFGKLTNIKPTVDYTKTRTYPEMLDAASEVDGLSDMSSLFEGGAQGLGGSDSGKLRSSIVKRQSAALGSRSSFRTVMAPALNVQWFTEIEAIFSEVMGAFFRANPSVTGTIAFQPFNNLIGKASAARGGNAMGLTGNDTARFILEIAFLWGAEDSKFDQEIPRLSKVFGDRVDALVQEKLSTASQDVYLPLFMNDAYLDQDVMGSYKDEKKFQELQETMDPSGFWKRTGGFKY